MVTLSTITLTLNLVRIWFMNIREIDLVFTRCYWCRTGRHANDRGDIEPESYQPLPYQPSPMEPESYQPSVHHSTVILFVRLL